MVHVAGAPGHVTAHNSLDDTLAALDARFVNYQPVDPDLTAVAALDSGTPGALATDGSGWVRKTFSQLKTALGLTKADVGLGSVDNTSDANKPVSTAAQTALDLKLDITTAAGSYQPVDSDLTAIAALSTTTYGRNLLALADAAALRTAAGLGTAATHPTTDFADATSTTSALAAKADLVGGFVPTSQIPALALTTTFTVASQAAMLALTASQVQPGDLAVRTDGAGTFILTATDPSVLGNWTRLNAPTDAVTTVNGQSGTVVLAASDVGAQPVDSDLTAIAALTTTSYGRAFLALTDAAAAKTALALVKADVGLGSVDNTSDAAKPVSTATATALALKAPLASPSFTGTATFAAPPIGAGIPSVINVKDYGAVGDGVTDDTTAIQNAINAAAVLGSSSDIAQGGQVFIPPGKFMISNPLVLPKTGNTPTNVVHLIGLNRRSCRIAGTSGFPTGRALIEWDTSTARAYGQRLENLTFVLPPVALTRAIHWELRAVSGALNASASQLAAERLQIDMDRIAIEGTNSFHQDCIYLEGSCWFSTFEDIRSDPNQGTKLYDTLLFKFDYAYSGTAIPSVNDDQVGCSYSRFHHIYGGWTRGGYNRTLEGRFLRCSGSSMFANGGQMAATVSYKFINSAGCYFEGTGSEGQGDTQYTLTNCESMDFVAFNMGAPGPLYSAWTSGTKTLATRVRTSNMVTNGYAWEVTTAGTTGGSEPSWPATPTIGTTTVTDGSVVWTAVGRVAGNGVELVNCKDIRINGLMVPTGAAAFHGYGAVAVKIDAASKRTRITDFRTSYDTTVAAEFDLSAASAADYFVSGINVANQTTFQYGTAPNGYMTTALVGAANGVAPLGSDGLVPSANLPSATQVNDVMDATKLFVSDDFTSGGTGSGQIGQYGWSTFQGSVNILAGVASHPGIVQRSTTSTSGTLSAFYLGNTASSGPIGPGDTFDATFWIRPSTLDANTKLRVGLSQAPASDAPGDSAYLERLYTDTNWFAVNRASSTQSTRVDMTVAPALNGWTKLRVRRVNSTTIGFTVDAGTEVTIASQAPATALQPFVQITNNSASAQTVDIDRVQVMVSGLTR